MKNQFYTKLLAVALLAFHLSASAEDTDLFVGLPPSDEDLPNVLIVLDNTGNWNTAFPDEKVGLKAVLDGLPLNKFRVGLMMYGTPENGYVRAGLRTMDATNKPVYSALVNSLDIQDDRQSARTMGNTLAEAYRYLMGQDTIVEGSMFEKRDYAGNVSGTDQSNAVYALPGNALSSAAQRRYTLPTIGCKTYIIYIGNTVAGGNVTQDNKSRNDEAIAKLSEAGGTTTEIPISPTKFQYNVADEWARFLRKQSSLKAKVYTIDVNPSNQANGPANSALLKSMAIASDAKYIPVRIREGDGGTALVDAMNGILSEIQSVNSVFASVSLPVSVNTQGTYRNQVYIGMFRPDDEARPRWAGNMKQYKLGYNNNVLNLQDANSVSAINSSTGFITECARSFWTPTLADSYWDFRPMGDCLTFANSDRSNSPDGNVVDKGAQAFQLRSEVRSTTKIKTCSPDFGTCAAGGASALTDFNTSNAAISQALLGAADSTERDALIDWARGLNVGDISGIEGGKATTVMRPSAHGDIVHSRPVAINFGTEIAPQVVVFYGGNDGVLRAINGNRTADIGSVAPGKELWAFMPPEYYSFIKRVRDNSIQINFPFNPTETPRPQPKPYGIDGPIAAYKQGSNTWIYTTMRRGGRVLYAFNVNSSNPTDITLKWKKGCPNPDNDDGCTSDFSRIGQTWSAPRTLTATGYGSGQSPLLLMGGGYDRCEDADQNTCTSDSKGRRIYVMDADTGARLRSLPTDRSVIADVFVVPDENTGKAKHAYAADLGGNIYRINIGDAAPADWTITKIASLGCNTTATCSANRKFMFSPDVIEDNGTYTLLIGSGDREKPLNSTTYPSTTSVSNYFFMIKDRPSDNTWLASETTNCGAAVICKASLYPITDNTTPTSADLATKKGWSLALRTETRDGFTSTEQVVTSAITVFDVVTFSTHIASIPVAGSCSPSLGTASVYNINYKNAKSANGTASRYETIAGGGLPPSPVAGMVTLDNGSTVPFCIGCNPDSPLEGGDPPGLAATNQPKARVYWYIQK